MEIEIVFWCIFQFISSLCWCLCWRLNITLRYMLFMYWFSPLFRFLSWKIWDFWKLYICIFPLALLLVVVPSLLTGSFCFFCFFLHTNTINLEIILWGRIWRCKLFIWKNMKEMPRILWGPCHLQVQDPGGVVLDLKVFMGVSLVAKWNPFHWSFRTA